MGKSCGDSSSSEACSDPDAARRSSQYFKDEGFSKGRGLVAWDGCGARVKSEDM